MSFIDARLAENSNLGSTYSEAYAVDVTSTLINRYSSLLHPYVQSRFTLRFDGRRTADQLDATVAMYHRAAGRMHVFRHKHHGDYSTNDFNGTPTSHDQLCAEISAVAKTYQITRWYDTASTTAPRRKIQIPVAGTVVVAKLNGATWTELTLTTHYTVSYSTGIITLVTALGVGDTLYAGCYFDIPVQFETDLDGVDWTDYDILSNQINLIEVRNIPA
jgi:uncharacterized protein (TIGR02217 family)